MKKALIFFSLQISFFSLFAQIKYGFRDEQGRHEIARGFVINTNDGNKDAYYSAYDYFRMVKMGANYQVVRLEMGKLQPSNSKETVNKYVVKLDSLVQLGKNAGIKTVFKMALYGARDFNWQRLFLNKNGEQKNYVTAWMNIWEKFNNEDYVIGYDLINEPRKEEWVIDYQQLSNNYLVPFYKYLIDEANKTATKKLYFVQDIFMNKGDKVDDNQYLEIQTKIDRKNVVFTPHIYEPKKLQIDKNMKRFEREAKLMDAPMLIGEWGMPTFDKTDSILTEQLRYIDFYTHTVNIMDSLGVGSIKAWFSGNSSKQYFLGAPSTWAIFQDSLAVGTIERKYITDIIARPYPQSIAGDILNFKFNFATRSLDLNLMSDNAKGISKIFISADRYYPDGFSILINNELILTHNPLKNTGLEVVKASGNLQPSDFIWDYAKQQLLVLKWPADKSIIKVRVVPGLHQ